MHISDEGRASMQKELEEKEKSSQEEQIKKKIAELQKELAKVNEKDDKDQSKKANAIMQQISMLSMQLVQLQKAKSENNV